MRVAHERSALDTNEVLLHRAPPYHRLAKTQLVATRALGRGDQCLKLVSHGGELGDAVIDEIELLDELCPEELRRLALVRSAEQRLDLSQCQAQPLTAPDKAELAERPLIE